jgi:hypothetical protein
VLRWALHEAARCAARPGSPDHASWLAVKQRRGAKRATLSVARKLARRPTTPCGSSATRPCGRCRCSRWREHGGTNTRGPTDQLMWCGWLPNAPLATLPSWAALTEQAAAPAASGNPITHAAGNPITHHVAGPRSEHQDKAGRPRAALPAPTTHQLPHIAPR